SDSTPGPVAWLGGETRALGFVGGSFNRGSFVSLPLGSRPATRRDVTPILTGWPLPGLSVSRAGHWLGLVSRRPGRCQVYVCPLGAAGPSGAPVLVARSGRGVGWSGDAGRLFVLDSTSVKVVRIAGGAAAGPPATLYDLSGLAERLVSSAFLPDG